MSLLPNPVRDLRVLASRDPRFDETDRGWSANGSQTRIVRGEDVYVFFVGLVASPETASGKPAEKANPVEC